MDSTEEIKNEPTTPRWMKLTVWGGLIGVVIGMSITLVDAYLLKTGWLSCAGQIFSAASGTTFLIGAFKLGFWKSKKEKDRNKIADC